MIYVNSKGKEVKVSDKRFEKYRKMEDNSQVWLDFRAKIFPMYTREELIMNPKPNVIMSGKDEELYDIWFWHGSYWFGPYSRDRIDEGMRFDTPTEAYEYFEKNIGSKY